MTAKDEIVARLRRELDRALEVREGSAGDPRFAARRQALRDWQAARLSRTYADLLESPRYGATARFFLTDLYGPRDLTVHESAVGRLIPVMERLLPAVGLQTVADAVELNALSESLDAAMVSALGAAALALDAAGYAAAYRKVGRRGERERQIELICELGALLDGLTRLPFIGIALSIMRKPALLAGLGELQDFLERGYAAFRGMQGADEFLSIIGARERSLLQAIFADEERAVRELNGVSAG